MIPQSAKSKPHQTFLECALEKRDRNCAIEEGDLFNCNKKGGLFSRLQSRGEALNLRPLGYELAKVIDRLCRSVA
jgi:hypothetical protein